MKKLFSCLLFFAIGCASTIYKFGNTIPDQEKHTSTISNNIVKIAAANPILSGIPDSAKNAYFAVYEDVKDNNGKIIVRKNESVSALITISSRAGGGVPGKIIIKFQETKDVKGRSIFLNSEPVEFEGASRRGLSIGLTVGMFFVYGPFNFFHLLHTGEDVSIPAGYIFLVKAK
jgi:hypothetical protein